MMKTYTLALFILLLSACSYHLRGATEIPEVLKHLVLQSASPLLHSSFKETLRLSGGNLLDKPDGKGVILNVLSERFDRRSLSLSETGKVNQFQLYYILDFDVLGADLKPLMPKQTVEINRDYFNNQQDIMGKNNEEAIIREEMYRQAVRTVMERGKAALRQNGK